MSVAGKGRRIMNGEVAVPKHCRALKEKIDILKCETTCRGGSEYINGILKDVIDLVELNVAQEYRILLGDHRLRNRICRFLDIDVEEE